MSTATVSGTPERPSVTAPLGAEALKGLSARLDKPLPVGNEGAGTVVAAGSSSAAQELARQNRGDRWRRHVRAVSGGRCLRVSCLARGDDGEGWGVVLRQSVDGSRNAGNHAPRRSFSPGAHGRGVEPRPDARQALQQGRGAACQHRPQARPRGAAEVARRGSCLQLGIAVLLDRSRRGSQSDVRDACVRCHRWGHARESDPQWHGGSGERERSGVLTLWVERSQAGVHLRRTRHESDDAHQELTAWRGVLAGGC